MEKKFESWNQDTVKANFTKEKGREEDEHIEDRLTPEGWMEVRWKSGKEVVIDPLLLSVTAVSELHKKFRDRHRQHLMAFMEAVAQVKKEGRTVPLLREELVKNANFNKQVIKDLISFGMIAQFVIPVVRGKTKLGGRAVLVPTLEARKLKQHIEYVMGQNNEQQGL